MKSVPTPKLPPPGVSGCDPASGRLAYVTKMFPRISETFVLNEVLALRRAGVPLRLYSILPPVRDRRTHPEAEALAADTVVLPQPSWRALAGFGASLARCFTFAPWRTIVQILRTLLRPAPRSFRVLFRGAVLADLVRRDEISHIHAAWAHTPASVARIASRLSRVPWSMAAHAKDIHTSDERSLARKMSKARFTLACTRHHRDLLDEISRRHAGAFPPGEVRLAYHGVDAGYFHPAEANGRESVVEKTQDLPVILFVGRLVAKKGPEILIEAASMLRAQGVAFRLELIGEGPLRAALQERIQALHLDDVVSLRGIMVREEVREGMKRAACFALPCRVSADGDRDGIPNSLAEAMAAGLAVVSTRLPSIEELVEDGRTGLLVPPEDPARLAEALAVLLRDPVARRRLGQRAREAVLEGFDAARCESERIAHLARGLAIQRVIYISGDRGVPVRGGKGASIHLRALLGAWRESGTESRIVTTNGGPERGQSPAGNLFEARAGSRITGLAKRLARLFPEAPAWERAFLRIADNCALYRAGCEAALGFRPDVVYERYALCSIAGSLLARARGIPHVLEVNAPLADEEERFRRLKLGGLTRALERWILRRADLVIVVSPPLAEHARRQGVAPGRIRVMPNGVDPKLFHTRRDGAGVRARLGLDDAFLAGFAGTLRPWHGVAHLIEGFARAVQTGNGMKLMILGEGPERAPLEALARERGVSDRVIFLGAVPHADMGDHLAACDVLCAPYGAIQDFYFSPIKIAEYLATGRPVIASAVGHLRHELGEQRGVLLTEPGDEAAIGAALLALAKDSGRRQALGAAAAAFVWSWSDVARETLREAAIARGRRWGWKSLEPLRIGYVLKVFPRFSETFILNEILEVERAGVSVVVFAMKPPPETIRQSAVARARAPVIVLSERAASMRRLAVSHLECMLRAPIRYARTLSFATSRRSQTARTMFLQAAILARDARRRGITHLHAHFANAPARQAKFASMLSGIPYSFTAHAKDLYWSGNAHGENLKLKHRVQRAAFVVTISERNRRFVESLGFRIRSGQIATIYNGVDTEAWPFHRTRGRPVLRTATSRSGRPPDREDPVILGVGRLVEKKGFDVLLRAAAILTARGVSFRCWIAGDGPERERLVGMIRTLRLEGAVQLLGPIRQDRLAAEFYVGAHVLAQPSVVAGDGDQDGIPSVILEAMTVGLPVVTTAVSGIPEAVEDGETGLLVPPGNPAALADALTRILADDALVERLASGARRRIEERFSLRQNVQQLIRAMRQSSVRVESMRRHVPEEAP